MTDHEHGNSRDRSGASDDIEKTPAKLRNPPLAYAPPAPEGQLPDDAQTTDQEGTVNDASNGYWLHDDVGPKEHEPPYSAAPDAERLMAVIKEQSGALQDVDASRAHVSVETDQIILSGLVDETEARRRLRRARCGGRWRVRRDEPSHRRYTLIPLAVVA